MDKANFWADTISQVTGYFENKSTVNAQTQTATATANAIANAVKGVAIIGGFFLLGSVILKKIFK